MCSVILFAQFKCTSILFSSYYFLFQQFPFANVILQFIFDSQMHEDFFLKKKM